MPKQIAGDDWSLQVGSNNLKIPSHLWYSGTCGEKKDNNLSIALKSYTRTMCPAVQDKLNLRSDVSCLEGKEQVA